MADKKDRAVKMRKSPIDEWEVKNAADTLFRAEEIKQDKKLSKLVDKELDKRRKALNSIKALVGKKGQKSKTIKRKK